MVTGPRLDFPALHSRGALFDPLAACARARPRASYWNISMSFHVPGAFEAPSRCACREKLCAGDADPAPGDPDGPDRPRPARHRPDGHRQDRRLHAALARPTRRHRKLPQARPCPDAGARADP